MPLVNVNNLMETDKYPGVKQYIIVFSNFITPIQFVIGFYFDFKSAGLLLTDNKSNWNIHRISLVVVFFICMKSYFQ